MMIGNLGAVFMHKMMLFLLLDWTKSHLIGLLDAEMPAVRQTQFLLVVSLIIE